MRPSIYSQLAIPEPCHEEWDRMTPEGNGRYCDSCEKVVVDFTAMNETQLSAVVDEFDRQGKKLCGRFRPDQLLGEVRHFYVRKGGLGMMRRFAAALFLVFGGFLFTGCQQKTAESPISKALASVSSTEPARRVSEPDMHRKVEAQPELEKVEIDPQPAEQVELVAEVLELEEVHIEKERVIEHYEGMVMGAMVRTEIISRGEILEIQELEEEEDVVIEPVPVEPLSIKVYPNPTADMFTLRLTNEAGEECTVMLFDINGRHLRNLVVDATAGVNEHRFHLGEYPPGIYLVTVVTATERVTAKIIRS